MLGRLNPEIPFLGTLQQYFYFFEFQTAPFYIHLKQDFDYYDVSGHLPLLLIY